MKYTSSWDLNRKKELTWRKWRKEFRFKWIRETKTLVGKGSYDKNLVKEINCRVISDAAYIMNVYNFTGQELEQLDKGIRKILRENNMHCKQCSDER